MQALLARRSLLTALFATPAAGASLPPPDAAVHLLNRTSFGVDETALARLHALGAAAYVDEQLHPDALDDTALDAVLAGLTTLRLGNAELVQTYAKAEPALRQLPLRELRAATVLRQRYSRRQLYEVLVEFWSNHFNVTHSDGRARYYKTGDDRDVSQAVGRMIFAEYTVREGDTDVVLPRGDVLLFGTDIFVGNTGNASNSAGVSWLQTQMQLVWSLLRALQSISWPIM